MKRQAFRPWKTLGKQQREYGVRGRTEHHERVSTMHEHKNPKEGRPAGPAGGGEVA